ncbi:DUF4235 domain-containing protein [Halomonas cerina]|uniref:DNA-binding helix-hairpin-helix protein with protein kinase domain n=1 Tax=Halomonas cerina TaxID=447424 RepID=A0A839VDF5_9GAMM|nr:DUF4235 domain-containing protein [Halomonas cerina]MBB3191990.1 DNA-binding helix-hairpin-helix protein with protein kinase domain [Halomonas cerina]
MKQETLWALASSAAAVAAGVMARKGAAKVYRRQVGEAPPANPAEPDVGWRQALLWGAATGILMGVARVVGRRAGSEAVRRTAGSGHRRRALRRLGR